MCRHHGWTVGRTAGAVVLWLSCLPVVCACDMFAADDTLRCALSKPAVIGIVVAIVVLLLVCGAFLRQRLRQRRVMRLSHVSNVGRRPSRMRKPCSVPASGGYPVYYEAAPAPLPVQTPRYPPRGYDTLHNHSRSQSSTIRTMPELATPASLSSMRAPSSTTSRPNSSLVNTTSPPLRSSVLRTDPIAVVPLSPSSPSSTLPHSVQRNVAEPPFPSLPASRPPRSPSVAISTLPALSPRPSGNIQLPNVARPSALMPIHTGASHVNPPPLRSSDNVPPPNVAHHSAVTPMYTGASNMDEPPPAYTPI